MRLIRKMYWIAAAVMTVAGFPYNGTEDFFTTLSFYFFLGIIFLYAAPKILRGGVSARRSVRAGSLQNHVIGGLQQGATRAVTGFMMGNGGNAAGNGVNPAILRKQAADERVRQRTQALNDAKFHEYYAKKNAGSYDGYRSANRAQAARNRARNL